MYKLINLLTNEARHRAMYLLPTVSLVKNLGKPTYIQQTDGGQAGYKQKSDSQSEDALAKNMDTYQISYFDNISEEISE